MYQTYYSEEQQDWVYEDSAGLLLFRRVLTAVKPAKINPERRDTDLELSAQFDHVDTSAQIVARNIYDTAMMRE